TVAGGERSRSNGDFGQGSDLHWLGLTTGVPSMPRVADGLNGPSSCRRHQAPVLFFVERSVNQYCHNIVLTIAGGLPRNGSFRNRPATSGLPSSKRSSVKTTHGFACHESRDANHRFHSKRG